VHGHDKEGVVYGGVTGNEIDMQVRWMAWQWLCRMRVKKKMEKLRKKENRRSTPLFVNCVYMRVDDPFVDITISEKCSKMF